MNNLTQKFNDEPPAVADERLNNPFDEVSPPEIAQRASRQLMVELEKQNDPLFTHTGKMFGVLVVRTFDNQIGFLKSFSGQWNGKWNVEGYVPPVFDASKRDAIEPALEKMVKSTFHAEEFEQLKREQSRIQMLRESTKNSQALEQKQLKLAHRENKSRRDSARKTSNATEILAQLENESRKDKREEKEIKQRHENSLNALNKELHLVERRIQAIERLRTVTSREAFRQICETYIFSKGENSTVNLLEIFAPKLPPSGAGDCSACKLLHWARALKLHPIAIAEFWWGAPPVSESRVQGHYYPACKDKCGPILPLLLTRFDVRAVQKHNQWPKQKIEPRVVYSDEVCAVIDKPAGYLSVPGRREEHVPSVVDFIKGTFPSSTGPRIVHRLDFDTSGLMVVALTEHAYFHLQQQFIHRQIEKKYVAIIEGILKQNEGAISLPLCVDLEQRPRQRVDFEHGKPATTHYNVLHAANGLTRIRFQPITGRTHQLRVHSAHALGLNAPIKGDPLYGKCSNRLYLHAEFIKFLHPKRNEMVEFFSAAPEDFF